MSVHPIIAQIIDSDCHVALTLKEVVRHVISKLKNGYETFRFLSEEEKLMFLTDCERQHQENFEEYRDVMSGRLCGRTKTLPSQRRPFPPEKLSGKDVYRMMRKHKVTIKSLSQRTGISMKRIREVREKGLTDSHAVRDWMEAISGIDPGPTPEKIRIESSCGEYFCEFCGSPLFEGESAFLLSTKVYCSLACSHFGQ